MSSSKPFTIAIVGGGIAGLTLAIALHRRSIPVMVYERAAKFGEIGAGVSFTANAVRAMEVCHPGVKDAFERVCTRNNWQSKQDVWFDFHDGVTTERKFTIHSEQGQNGVHRAHFLDELVKLLPADRAQFGKSLEEIVDHRDGQVEMKFGDGTSAFADAVIGCDGIKSRVRRHVVGLNDPSVVPSYTHKYCYRAMVTMEQAIEALGEEKAENSCMHLGPRGHVLTFSVDHGRKLNIVAFHQDDGDWADYERTTKMASRENAFRDFAEFGPDVSKLLQMADEQLNVWAIFDLGDNPVPTFTKGRVCISGDAAHATSPHHGAGAGMCIEDSAVLAEILADPAVRAAEDLAGALDVFNASRKERGQWLVQSSRRIGNVYDWMQDDVGQDPAKAEAEINERNGIISNFDLQKACSEAREELQSRLAGPRPAQALFIAASVSAVKMKTPGADPWDFRLGADASAGDKNRPAAHPPTPIATRLNNIYHRPPCNTTTAGVSSAQSIKISQLYSSRLQGKTSFAPHIPGLTMSATEPTRSDPDPPSQAHAPTPKSRPRASRACEACRSAKKKCDDTIPCTNCLKKGLGEHCSRSSKAVPSNRFSTARPSAPGAQRSARVTYAREDRRDATRELGTRHSSHQAGRRSASQRTPRSDDDEVTSPSDAPRPEMLLGSAGEKVYVGSSAAISFLQFLRNTLRFLGGPSGFTESRLRHAMLEADPDKNLGHAEPFEDFLSDEAKLELASHYLEATSGFISIYSRNHIVKLIRLSSSDPSGNDRDPICSSLRASRQDQLASLYLVLAIGACCRGRKEVDARAAPAYFAHAQQLAFRNMLHDPTLIMVNHFVLMAFYMFCACRRNTGLLYLGIAAKGATILGLHSLECFVSSISEPGEREVAFSKLRTWKSLRVLDLQCNIILGRPTSINVQSLPQLERRHANSGGPSGANTPTSHDAFLHAEAATNANYDLCAHLEEISQAVMKRGTLDLDSAETFLGNLREWAKGLPDNLREGISGTGSKDAVGSAAPPPSSNHRQKTIGNIHVACGYYFGVLLITRPFLVARVVPTLEKVRNDQADSANNGPEQHHAQQTRRNMSEKEYLRVQELSQVCLAAAVHLMQMCKDAHALDLLIDNMSILQAWVLAAGLILGFSLLAPGEALHQEARSAFSTARRVTARMCRLSPQARRNMEILSSFSDAIDGYQDKINRQTRSSSDSLGSVYLERILRPPADRQSERWAAGSLSEAPNADRLPSTSFPSANLAATSSQSPQSLQSHTNHSMGGEGLDWLNGWTHGLNPQISDETGYQQFWDEYVDNSLLDEALGGTGDDLSGIPWGAFGS